MFVSRSSFVLFVTFFSLFFFLLPLFTKFGFVFCLVFRPHFPQNHLVFSSIYRTRLITDRSLVSLCRPFYPVSLLLNQPRLYSFVSLFVCSSFNFSLASHESRSKTIGVSSRTKKAFLRACPVIDHETPPFQHVPGFRLIFHGPFVHVRISKCYF